MPLVTRQTCGLCQQTSVRKDADGHRERLTRCLGHTFLVRSVLEGITKDEEGAHIVADFLLDSRKRATEFSCGSHDGEFYFHQSCEGRAHAAALSFDARVVSSKETTSDAEEPVELANFTHQLCSGCISKAADELGEDLPDDFRGPKYQALSGEL